MNLVQIGFLSLTLLALADGSLWASGGGFGGISAMFGIPILFIFIAALVKRTKLPDCPANYTPTPNDPTSCIRFISSPTKNFNDARTACVSDAGQLLKLSTAAFPFIQQLAQNNSGGCSHWVDAREDNDGDWFAFNNFPIPNTPGIFLLEPTNNRDNDCGLMTNAGTSFYLAQPALSCTVTFVKRIFSLIAHLLETGGLHFLKL